MFELPGFVDGAVVGIGLGGLVVDVAVAVVVEVLLPPVLWRSTTSRSIMIRWYDVVGVLIIAASLSLLAIGDAHVAIINVNNETNTRNDRKQVFIF